MIIYTSKDVLSPTPKYGGFPDGTKTILLTNFASLYVTIKTSSLDITLPPVTALVAPVDAADSWEITAVIQPGTVNPSSEQYVSMTFQPFPAPLSLRSIHLLAPVQGQSPSKGSFLNSGNTIITASANTTFLTVTSGGVGVISFSLNTNAAGIIYLTMDNGSPAELFSGAISASIWYTASTPVDQGTVLKFSSSVAATIQIYVAGEYFV